MILDFETKNFAKEKGIQFLVFFQGKTISGFIRRETQCEKNTSGWLETWL